MVEFIMNHAIQIALLLCILFVIIVMIKDAIRHLSEDDIDYDNRDQTVIDGKRYYPPGTKFRRGPAKK